MCRSNSQRLAQAMALRAQVLHPSHHVWNSAVFIFLLAASLAAPARLLAGDAAKAKELAEKNLKHRQSFQRGVCELWVRAGVVRSMKDAEQGKFVDEDPFPLVTWNCRWIFDDPKMMFVESCPGPQKSVAAGPAVRQGNSIKQGRIGCVSSGYLSDGRIWLSTSDGGGFLFGANIEQVDSNAIPTFGPSNTPFSCGTHESYNPFQQISEFTQKGYCEYLGTQDYSGQKVEVVAVGASAKKISHRFSFDPARGYLPIRIEHPAEDAEGQTAIEVRMLEIKKITGNRWLPTRTLAFHSYPHKLGKEAVYGARLVEVVPVFDFDGVPPEDEFTLDLPEGTLLTEIRNQMGDLKTQFSTREDRQIRVKDLPELLKEIRNHK